MPSPIAAALAIDVKPEKEIRDIEYRWEQLYGGDDVRRFHAAHGPTYVVASVKEVYGKYEDRDAFREARDQKLGIPGILGYQCKYDETQEAWVYPDGFVLVASMFASFAGTFGPEEQTVLTFFALTPA